MTDINKLTLSELVTKSVVEELFFSRPHMTRSPQTAVTVSSSHFDSWIPLSSNAVKCKRCRTVVRLSSTSAKPIIELSSSTQSISTLALHQESCCSNTGEKVKKRRRKELNKDDVESQSSRGSTLMQLALASHSNPESCAIPLMTAAERTLRYSLVYPMNSSAWLCMNQKE